MTTDGGTKDIKISPDLETIKNRARSAGDEALNGLADALAFGHVKMPLKYTENLPLGEMDMWVRSTKIAWDLRMAYSAGDSDLIREIKNKLVTTESIGEPMKSIESSNRAKFEYYVVYQLLTDSFELERDFFDSDPDSNPKRMDSSMREYALDVIKVRMGKTKEIDDLRMLNQIIQRAFDIIPGSLFGSSYVGIKHEDKMREIMSVLVNRSNTGGDIMNSDPDLKKMVNDLKSIFDSNIHRMDSQSDLTSGD